MNSVLLFVCTVISSILFVNCAVIDKDDVAEQGLYSSSDDVEILTGKNFDKKVYGKEYALLIQFYNSFCGHCRAFAPKYKTVAKEIINWRKVVRPAACDCAAPENLDTCRDFEVLSYPSVRYIHENYQKGDSNKGRRLETTDTADQFKANLITMVQSEQDQDRGRMKQIPPLNIACYSSFTTVLQNVSNDDLFIFLIFEPQNSTIGSEVSLDINEYPNVRIIRINEHCGLATEAGVHQVPALIAIRRIDGNQTPLTPSSPTKINLIRAINIYLMSKNYEFPHQDNTNKNDHSNDNNIDKTFIDADIVYYSDLEKTIRTMLLTEIPKYKILDGKPLDTLNNIVDVMIDVFPFKEKTKHYFIDLRISLLSRNQWTGVDIYNVIKGLENKHYPVYSITSDSDYIACKGSQSKYRGYTCGLWSLFHVLTVNAAKLPGKQGPEVLKAMHDYVKYFFGCTDCSKHFQEMAVKNQLFEVTENDKAVLWLWISHNEVNLRLAGDSTEDPYHPKIQFPSSTRCPTCRQPSGQWNLPAVYQYLQNMYSVDNLYMASSKSASAGTSPFTNIDIGMLSFLYILSFGFVILVVKYLTRGFYRKKYYKNNGWGKV